MKRNAVIEPWSKDTSYVHVHSPGFTGIRWHDGGVVADATVEQVLRVGVISGALTLRFGRDPYLQGSCHEFCRMVEDVLGYSDSEIATSRGQMEDAGFEESGKLESLEIAWLDRELRERWADQARDENPYLESMKISIDVEFVISQYMQRMHPEVTA